MTAAPTALVRVRSTNERTTSSATSASSSARLTSRIATFTSSSERAPRPVSLSSMPESFSDRLSNMVGCSCSDAGQAATDEEYSDRLRHPLSPALAVRRRLSEPTPIAPGGAMRCRTVTAGLGGTVGLIDEAKPDEDGATRLAQGGSQIPAAAGQDPATSCLERVRTEPLGVDRSPAEPRQAQSATALAPPKLRKRLLTLPAIDRLASRRRRRWIVASRTACTRSISRLADSSSDIWAPRSLASS